ncbi:hypothetical protein C0J52_10519 [Blattella germanica]|nr:hypothetical protein C0J52_10519 [Blattella germanica]
MAVGEGRMGFLVLCCLLGVATAREFVPVLILSSSEQEIGTPSALKQLSTQDFADHFNQRLENKPLILVFEEENLSVEDFTNAGFSKLQNLGKSSEFLPSVQNPLRALKKIGSVHSSLEDVPAQGLAVVLVKMDDAGSYEDRPHLLMRHDSKMNEMFARALKKRSDVVLVYTGRYTSWTEPEEVHRVRRLLEENNGADNSSSLAMVTENILIYASTMPILIIQNETISLTHKTAVTQDIRENFQSLTAKFASNGKAHPVMLNFFFYNSTSTTGYWVLENITAQGEDIPTQVFSPESSIVVPQEFSYHCTARTAFTNENGTLSFSNFQAQAYMEQKGTFGDAYNCEMFFTAPIWSGLFVMSILAFIMIWGLVMIMDIRTMDQFDDPKGKTITISAVD